MFDEQLYLVKFARLRGKAGSRFSAFGIWLEFLNEIAIASGSRSVAIDVPVIDGIKTLKLRGLFKKAGIAKSSENWTETELRCRRNPKLTKSTLPCLSARAMSSESSRTERKRMILGS